MKLPPKQVSSFIACLLFAAVALCAAASEESSGGGDEFAFATLVCDNGTLAIGYTPATIGELFAAEGILPSPEAFGLDPKWPVSRGQAVVLPGLTFLEASAECEIEPRVAFDYEFRPELHGIEIVQKGMPGREKIRLRRFYLEGKPAGETRTSTIIKEPVKTIVKMYTGVNGSFSPQFHEVLHNPVLSDSLPAPAHFARKISMEATAYYPGFESNGKYGYTTAMGFEARPGRVAVDPGVIRLGSVLFVSGYGYCVAVDTGGAIKGNRIDLCYNTREECFQFGRRQVDVYVLE